MNSDFTEQETRDLLERDEGQFLEFKSLWDLGTGHPKVRDRRSVRDDIAECVAAFANADGGILLLGVDDDGTPSGHGYPEEAMTGFLETPERRFTNEDYRTYSGGDRDQAYREIQEMVSSGVVMPAEAPGRGAIYRVSPELRLARAWLGRRVPKLRDHFSENARLTNSDYRDLMDVTRNTAFRELRRLVEEGFLRLHGERKGAYYEPGPGLAPEGGDK